MRPKHDPLKQNADLAHAAAWGGRPSAQGGPQQNSENRDFKFCLKNKARLNRWERAFVESLVHQDFPLTAKQQNILADIIGKILAKRRR